MEKIQSLFNQIRIQRETDKRQIEKYKLPFNLYSIFYFCFFHSKHDVTFLFILKIGKNI